MKFFLFSLLALIGSIVARQLLLNQVNELASDNDSDDDLATSLRLRQLLLNRYLKTHPRPARILVPRRRDLARAPPHNALGDVQLFETSFKNLVKTGGFAKAAVYIADEFVHQRAEGKTFNKKQYLNYLSTLDLEAYFANPTHAHYGDNKELYVTHEEEHQNYEFELTPTPALDGKYRLVAIRLEKHNNLVLADARQGGHSAKEDTLAFEAAFKELAASGVSKAGIYIDDAFVYTNFDGKKKNKQQFLDYLSHDENINVYFSNPINPQFDKEDNLIFSHKEHNINFVFFAKPANLKGGYKLVSVSAGAQSKKRRLASKKRRNIESSSSSSEEDVF